jgi:hypothetical protein
MHKKAGDVFYNMLLPLIMINRSNAPGTFTVAVITKF